MPERFRGSRFAPACALVAVSWLMPPSTADASPITLNLQGRITSVCELIDSGSVCTPHNERIPITVMYDPDTITVDDVGFGWQMFVSSVHVTIPIAPIPNPFGGPTTIISSGGAFFSNNGPGFLEYREGGAVTSETFIEDVCRPDGICGYNEWRAGAGIGDDLVGTPPLSGPPTAADFEELLVNGTFGFETYVQLFDVGGHREHFAPGSRIYTGNIPEPPQVVLFGLGSVVAACGAWRRRMRTR